MSTQPHNAPDAAHVDQSATVLPVAGPDLDAAVRHFVATADAFGAPRPSSDELQHWIHQVVDITRELFPGKLVVETGVDPETPDDVSLLIQVEATGSVDEIVALDDDWHGRIVSIAPQWAGFFRLLIDAR
jgi:hypothetical protein